jgi:hypothetical protein
LRPELLQSAPLPGKARPKISNEIGFQAISESEFEAGFFETRSIIGCILVWTSFDRTILSIASKGERSSVVMAYLARNW